MTDMSEINTQEAAPAHKSIYSALAAAQAEMGRARKDAKNPHFKSKYADLSSVMDACMPPLTRHGIAVIQPTGEEEGQRFVETILVHGETGQEAKCRVPLIVAKNDMQGFGSAVTYARRYGLMSMAGVAPDDDDGQAAAKSPPRDERSRDPSPKKSGPSLEAVQIATGSLEGAETIDALRAIWSGLPREVQEQPGVIKAKDDRKTILDAEPLLDDSIPFDGS